MLVRASSITVLVVLGLGCDRADQPPPAERAGEEVQAAPEPPERDRMAEMDRPREPRPVPPPPLNERLPPHKLAASHVLLMYEGSERSKATRSKEDARALAQKVLERARKGEEIAVLARELSDCPTKGKGGYLGAFAAEDMVPAFSKAVAGVRPDELVDEVVETQFGFHVIRREQVIHLGHLLVQHRAAKRTHSGITRSREEAEKAIAEAREALTAPGAEWSAIVAERSDCMQTKAVGGDLGYFDREARLLPEMREASGRLRPGEVSEVFETDYGFHVMLRYPEGAGPGGRPAAAAAEGEAAGPAGAETKRRAEPRAPSPAKAPGRPE